METEIYQVHREKIKLRKVTIKLSMDLKDSPGLIIMYRLDQSLKLKWNILSQRHQEIVKAT